MEPDDTAAYTDASTARPLAITLALAVLVLIALRAGLGL